MSHRLSFPTACDLYFPRCVSVKSSVGAADRNVLFIITDDESPTLGLLWGSRRENPGNRCNCPRWRDLSEMRLPPRLPAAQAAVL